MADKFMLIDGNSLLYRAFYALPLLHNSAGVYTNGVYGFLTMLNRVLAELQPTHIAVAFDKDRHTFRNEIYSEYKANRSAPPEELSGQFQLLRDVLAALNIEYLEMQGYEADDIIGTLSKRAEEQGLKTLILTGDADVLQLISEQVEVLLTKKGISEMELYDSKGVRDKWGVEPEKMIEIKGLMGDASDNIPGVPGVGPKTAKKLVQEFSSLENLYENLAQVKGKKLLERLEQNREQAFLSRQLATIDCEMELDFQVEDYLRREPHYPELLELYRRLEFNNFLKNLQEKGHEIETDEEVLPLRPELELRLLAKEEDARVLQEEIKEGESVALYFQSNYHHPMWGELQAIFLEYGEQLYQLKLDDGDNDKVQWLKPLLESAAIKKYLHNAKFAQVILLRHGIKLAGIAGDTMLIAYVDDPAFAGEELEAALRKYLQLDLADDKPSVLASRIKELYSRVQLQMPAELQSLLQEVEMPMSEVLARMEFSGVKVERSTLARISGELAGGISSHEEEIFRLAGSSFNVNSPKQLGKVLFEDLGLRVIKKGKTGYSTSAEVLEELYQEHEIIAHILNYRQLSKLKSTYADALQELIHPETGRVHTIFKQAQTATGRLSSVEPNLQNIPIRMEEGRRIRQAFVARDPDWLFMSADYSQIDLRSLAHISGDERLIEAFSSGLDIHTRTAAEIFHLPVEWVDEELRRKAKAVNFGIIYGISDFGLARDTGVTRQEARKYIDKYLNTYPGVKKYMEDIVEFGRRHGYVETLLKRRRYLPELSSRNKMVQAFGRRMALNTPIQGTSADIIKLAMIKVDREIRERRLQARMLLQVHDELLLELPPAELEEASNILRDCMENACSLQVPLQVSLNAGPNWYEMGELK